VRAEHRPKSDRITHSENFTTTDALEFGTRFLCLVFHGHRLPAEWFQQEMSQLMFYISEYCSKLLEFAED